MGPFGMTTRSRPSQRGVLRRGTRVRVRRPCPAVVSLAGANNPRRRRRRRHHRCPRPFPQPPLQPTFHRNRRHHNHRHRHLHCHRHEEARHPARSVRMSFFVYYRRSGGGRKIVAARPFLLGLAGCVTAPPRWPWGLNRAGCTKKRAGGAGQFPWLHISYGSAPENRQQQPRRETAFSCFLRLLAPSLVVSSFPPPNPPSPPLPSSSSFSPSSPSLPPFLLNTLSFLLNTLSFPLSLS